VFLDPRDLLDLRDPWVNKVFLDPRVLRDKWGLKALRDLLEQMDL
jgi:hypothetical protein